MNDKLFEEACEAFDKLKDDKWLYALDRYFYTIGYKEGYEKGLKRRPPLSVWVNLSWLFLVPLSFYLSLTTLGLLLRIFTP